MMEDTPDPAPPQGTGEAEQDQLLAACDLLQQELDALLTAGDGDTAAASLDAAIGSFRRIEAQNVSSVQLVALAGA
jgi:hypothetical protein